MKMMLISIDWLLKYYVFLPTACHPELSVHCYNEALQE